MNDENLKKYGKEKKPLSREEAVRNGKKGGIASVQARKERKLIKERILEQMTEDDWQDMINGLITRSKNSVRDFEVLRDTIGEKPTDVIEVSTPISETAEKIRKILEDE